ncbi:hypothetical protein SUGI_0185190 [Cryptomeria japonica]|uniref:uncharacterized protein LOC131051894 n=1 Tax=Cryptomeria japonica TaxID=3369 RepID=UPI002408E9CD|nr:uncharacterized protein LOC131051894 [Cryptomeria japonica]GLJ12136.1 hypothetical protein SUGI_0185190 [Cryptomeria japonica]
MAMCEEEVKIRAELEKEIEKDLEEEMKENISRLTRKLAQLHAHQESQTEVFHTTGKSANTLLNRDRTECPAVKHLKRPAKIADRKDSEKKFKRLNLDKDFDWVRSLRSGSPSRHEFKANYTIAAPERARKCRSVMATRGREMSGSCNQPPFRGRHESKSWVFNEDVKAIPVPFKGKGKLNAKAIP